MALIGELCNSRAYRCIIAPHLDDNSKEISCFALESHQNIWRLDSAILMSHLFISKKALRWDEQKL